MEGGRSMYQIQAAVAMEQKQMRLDVIGTGAAGDQYKGARNIFIQELPVSIPEEFSYMSTGSPQDLRTRTCMRSCKDT